MMDVNFEKAEKEWAPVVGRFIVDFVMIEDAMSDVIEKNRHRLTDKELKGLDRFKTKRKLYLKVMRLYLEPMDVARLHEVMVKVKELYEVRNLLAHNSLSFVYEQESDEKLKVVGFQVIGKKNELSMNLSELKKKVQELQFERKRFSELSMAYYEAELRFISGQ